MRTILTTTGTSLLTNSARELNKKAASVTDEELRHFFEQVGAAKASAETNSLLKIAENLAQLAFVESVIGGHFENTTMRRIKSVNDDGSIRLLWADNQKAVNITVQTTARGQVQTLKMCNFIRPLLDA